MDRTSITWTAIWNVFIDHGVLVCIKHFSLSFPRKTLLSATHKSAIIVIVCELERKAMCAIAVQY